MSNTSATGPYLSFVHDGDIVPLMAALELVEEEPSKHEGKSTSRLVRQDLPTNSVKRDRSWRISDIVPMGGRLAFERINCQKARFTTPQNKTFVRLIINDGHFSLNEHVFGDVLEHDMRLQRFESDVAAKERKFGDFRTVCGLKDTAPSKITFLHQ